MGRSGRLHGTARFLSTLVMAAVVAPLPIARAAATQGSELDGIRRAMLLGAAGSPDPSFSADGRVLTDFTPRDDFAIDVAVQNDGRIVAGGVSNVGRDDRRFALARYNTNGTLDPTFSGDGKVQTNFRPSLDAVNDLALQADGKIVGAGLASSGELRADFALARYQPNGSLDPTFGGDGRVTTSLTPRRDSITGIVILDDGDIVAAGIAGFLGSNPRFGLARFNPNGTLDDAFGGDGKVTTDFTGGWDAAWTIAVQPDGKLLVAGAAGDPAGKFALARYLSDGTLDQTFSGDGKLTTNFTPRYDEALEIGIQLDEKIVAVGAAGWGTADPSFALARYGPNGALDTTFHGDGKVRTQLTARADAASDMRVQADGRIVVVGEARADRPDSLLALVRYEADGTLDQSFGAGGITKMDLTRGVDFAEGVDLQPDGAIVIAGGAGVGINGRFLIARFLGNVG